MLETLLFMQRIKKKIHGVKCVSCFLLEDWILTIRVDWEVAHIVNTYSMEFLRMARDINVLENYIISDIESKYKVWEVGEE